MECRLQLLGAWLCIVGFSATWVLEGELVQGVSTSGGYDKPYFLNYCTNSFYTLYLLPWILWRGFRPLPAGHTGQGGRLAGWMDTVELRLVWTALKLTPMYIFVGYTWFLSLPRTSVAANTIIYNSGPAFVFVLAVWLLNERVTTLKVVSVAVCLGGVCLVTLAQAERGDSEDSSTHHSAFGYICVIISTLLYALFEVLYQKVMSQALASERAATLGSHKEDSATPATAYGTGIAVPDIVPQHIAVSPTASIDSALVESPSVSGHAGNMIAPLPASSRTPIEQAVPERSPMKQAMETVLFLGCIGLSTMVLTWPGIVVLHVSGAERFKAPSNHILTLITYNSMLDASTAFFLVLGIVLSSSLFMAVGSLLSIPVSLVADLVFHSSRLSGTGYIGMALIMSGFLALNATEYWHSTSVGGESAHTNSEIDETRDLLPTSPM